MLYRRVLIALCAGVALFLLLFRVEVEESIEPVYVTPSSASRISIVDCNAVVPAIYTKPFCLKGLPKKRRKRLFISMLLPSIMIENFKIAQLRKRVLRIKERMEEGEVSDEEMAFLKKLCDKYRASSVDELLYKIDEIPAGLVLAQAALESGWGASRFFCEGNNIFGEWDFSGKRGIKARGSDARLKRFASILDAVDSYFYNINAGWAYESFRIARRKCKNSLELAKYLEMYSVLRREYIRRLERLIESEGLYKYDRCKLNESYIHRHYRIVPRLW